MRASHPRRIVLAGEFAGGANFSPPTPAVPRSPEDEVLPISMGISSVQHPRVLRLANVALGFGVKLTHPTRPR